MEKNWRQSVWELIKFVAITLLIVIPIRTYVAQPFIVSGLSMFPAFDDHEYLIVDELSYHFRAPERGEVVIFKYPKDPTKYFIKRIVGLPGETIVVKNNQTFIKTGDKLDQINEPYITAQYWADSELTLGADDYFVMGDNRAVSLDSRSWGPLPGDHITGRAYVRLFPLNKIAILPGHD